MTFGTRLRGGRDELRFRGSVTAQRFVRSASARARMGDRVTSSGADKLGAAGAAIGKNPRRR